MLDKKFKKKTAPQIKTHQKKFLNQWKKQCNRCPECVMNLSKRKLTLNEKNALQYGLSHLILPRKVKKDQAAYVAKINLQSETAFRCSNK